jgi:tetratricopeptide (TPR) repeat protein
VQRAWAEEIPRLLVFDNVDTDDAEKLVQQYRPTTGGCRVLITSRRGVWDKALGIVALPLGVLQRAESIALLRQFRTDLSDADADAIAEELGDLPLALHLAGSYLASYADNPRLGDPQRYLARLREKQLEHASMRGKSVELSPTQHELHVSATFSLSYERLKPTSDIDMVAQALLARSAYFAPGEPIPRALLLDSLSPGDDDADEDETEEHRESALRRLRTLGLLERGDGGVLTLHRLLARFVQGTSKDDSAQSAVEQAIISTVSDLNKQGIPAPLPPLLPHLRYSTDVALKRADEQAATLATNLGYCLHTMLADYAGARLYFERALAIREQVLGPEHPHTAQSLNNLALLLQAQGNYVSAKLLFERALAIREQMLGPEHPHTAQSLNNLALLLQAQGDYAPARPLSERALAIREQVLGANHPDTARNLNNLAALLKTQGDYAAARPLYERVLAIQEQVLGPQHPDTQVVRGNLAALSEAIERQAHPWWKLW